MTINPLGPNRPVGPSGPIPAPSGPAAPAPGTSPQAPGTFGSGLVPKAGHTAPVPGEKSLDRATYDRISRRIREAAAAGKSVQESLAPVIEDEFQHAFGTNPSSAQLAELCEWFQSQPQLKGLFSKLHRKALG